MTVCNSSSSQSHQNRVITGKLGDFWESNGECPHWITLRAQFRPQMELRLWMQDRNTYTPAKLCLWGRRAATSQWQMLEELSVSFPLKDGGEWLKLHTFTQGFELIKVDVLDNYDGGINCKLGQLILLEASSTPQVTALPRFYVPLVLIFNTYLLIRILYLYVDCSQTFAVEHYSG